ncbi:polysaccharide lyase family 1 protein [Candidatus Omnitrophota bacterium]
MQRSLIIIIAFITILMSPVIALAQPAFPGAEGFGANSIGGRGGDVYVVTNLNDDGPGSLRAAVEAKGRRIVVFEISGTIAQKSVLTVRNPYLTIAGQTAPGGGICLRDNGLVIAADHVIVRFIRVRPGDNVSKEPDGMNLSAGKNVIIDHCSTSWSVDENLSCSSYEGRLDNVTVQWCFITESLHNSVHWKGPHGMGSLNIGGKGVKWSYHHNLYALNNDRNPTAGNYQSYDVDPDVVTFDIRNNVVYDWGHSPAGHAAGHLGKIEMNLVNNYYKTGRDTRGRSIFGATVIESREYVSGNCMNGTYPEDPWSLILFTSNFSDKQKTDFKLSSPVHVALVKTDDAITAYAHVLVFGGATLPLRDAVDERIVNHVINGTGRIIDDEAEVGGWPELKSTPPPSDSDRDGMPDVYETSNKLNPRDPSDAKGTNVSPEGYTNIEVYINDLAANTIVGRN